MTRIALLPILFCTLLAASPVAAGELFGGAFIHDVKTPLDLSGIEKGIDIQAGYRGGRIASTPIQPYAFAALNSAGATSYAAVGLSAKFGDKFYVRPGIGLAIHNGSAGNFVRTDKIAFGSRILFEPELGAGVRLNRRLSAEASWVHMSHGTLFSGENPGVDNVGFRLNFAL
ncbi:MAG: acyloxyacyl hydrolase [Sphingomicrobium sp.]